MPQGDARPEQSGVVVMRRTAVSTAVLAIIALVAALTSCSTGQRVDLGDGGSGNLVAAIAGEPDQLDPHKTSAYFSFEVLENVFDTLVAPDANLEMQPALAQSWDVSPDQLNWTFHLRRGVKFHDGSPFSAADVVYSYRRIIDQKLANADKFSAVTDVSARDPDTVTIRLEHPTPNLLTNLGGFKGMAIVQRQNVESGKDRHTSRRHRAIRVRRAEKRGFDHAEGQSGLLGRPAEGRRRDVPLHPRGVHRTVGAAGRRDRLD
jgi:peptide/nickel transport system substrate-binding protein